MATSRHRLWEDVKSDSVRPYREYEFCGGSAEAFNAARRILSFLNEHNKQGSDCTSQLVEMWAAGACIHTLFVALARKRIHPQFWLAIHTDYSKVPYSDRVGHDRFLKQGYRHLFGPGVQTRKRLTRAEREAMLDSCDEEERDEDEDEDEDEDSCDEERGADEGDEGRDATADELAARVTRGLMALLDTTHNAQAEIDRVTAEKQALREKLDRVTAELQTLREEFDAYIGSFDAELKRAQMQLDEERAKSSSDDLAAELMARDAQGEHDNFGWTLVHSARNARSAAYGYLLKLRKLVV
jgi:hypothetical protein